VREESAFSGLSTDEGATGPTIEERDHRKARRIPVLDGWRATSILLVLGSHLVPLGPHWLELNYAAGAMGMALFFTLSGFLITQFLAAGMKVKDFLARRLARILPLCWTAVIALLLWHRYDFITGARNLLFVANLPPVTLLRGGEHLWSLGVEMQFYIGIALVCALMGRRGLYLIPLAAVAVTLARIFAGEPISIVTWHRVDEILGGGIIALIYSGWFGQRAREVLERLPIWPFALGLLVSSSPYGGAAMYLRPYAAALLVGASLNGSPARLKRVLVSRQMAYIAEVSYALYVIHGVLNATWLGSGDHLVRDLKRPLLIAVTFALAHISTRYFEQPITRAVRRLTNDRSKRATASHAAPTPTLLVGEDVRIGADGRPLLP
jgi:peptidoglycan/LPS O-acetylase OafA/YrhL